MTSSSRLHSSFLISLVLLLLLLALATLPSITRVQASDIQQIGDTETPTPTSTDTSAPDPTATATTTETASPTPTDTETASLPIQETPTETPTPTETSTESSTPTSTNTATPTSLPRQYLPLIPQGEVLPFPTFTPTPTSTPTSRPPLTQLFCDTFSYPINIPDNNPSGISDVIAVADSRQVIALSLYLDIRHDWVGDLIVTLANQSSGQSVTALHRPGIPGSSLGCSYDDIRAILEDNAAQPAENKCAYLPAAISGDFQPHEPLSDFIGDPVEGAWVLNVSDNYPNDVGALYGWCIEVTYGDSQPSPTPTPTLVWLPDSAFVSGMSGEDQALPLDCESRSAVDWAAHWGFNIDELEFFYNLPSSDDPDDGFVGNVYGNWGQIPPNDYGVHAPPIADLLNDYGLIASPFRSLRWDDVRAEIADGNPVIVWIIGGANHTLARGIPRYYTASSNGHTTVVAAYEHTVIVVGYSPTEVTVLNGAQFVDVPLNLFLDSWSALRFMGVLARP